MIRNTRSGCGVPFPKRFATTMIVHFNEEEQKVYDQICTIAHLLSSSTLPTLRLLMKTLLERAGAHLPLALNVLRTLSVKLRDDTLLESIEHGELIIPAIESAIEGAVNLSGATEKVKKLIELLCEAKQPTIVFCRHTSTVDYLCGELLMAGIPYSSFHGAMPQQERMEAIQAFRDKETMVLVSSESGGEGQNLQFCNALVNFDLPWNPMQIEQRIGRIHRIGQDRDVFVFNLCYAGTLEEKVLGILESKIRMFELVVGEVDSILGNLDERGGFSDVVMDLWVRSADSGGREKAFEDLGEFLQQSRQEYLDACRLDNELFGREMEV
jgi:SNF2 family DNA or RNA helicase